MKTSLVSRIGYISFVVVASTTIAASAQTFTTLLSFDGRNGSVPYFASLVQGLDGNLYGTTYYGGNGNCNDNNGSGCGTVFRVTLGGTLTTLHSFQNSDGSYPASGLTLAEDGSFYGTTSYGGANGLGTLFEITPSGQMTTLHSFSGTDGKFPDGALVQATDGNFYGTTAYGGNLTCNAPSGCGTVFRMSLTGGFTTLHSFDGADGVAPAAGLVEGTDGILYGTATDGGVVPPSRTGHDHTV